MLTYNFTHQVLWQHEHNIHYIYTDGKKKTKSRNKLNDTISGISAGTDKTDPAGAYLKSNFFIGTYLTKVLWM